MSERRNEVGCLRLFPVLYRRQQASSLTRCSCAVGHIDCPSLLLRPRPQSAVRLLSQALRDPGPNVSLLARNLGLMPTATVTDKGRLSVAFVRSAIRSSFSWPATPPSIAPLSRPRPSRSCLGHISIRAPRSSSAVRTKRLTFAFAPANSFPSNPALPPCQSP